MSLSFTKEYYPNLSEIRDEDIAAARERVVEILRPHFPDVDMSPGTPTGDLIVSSLAGFNAVSEEAHRRFMSDLDLENVAAGVIYSCDFVQRYLGNFAVYDVDNLRSTGLVRLTFSSPSGRLIPRSRRFKFTSSPDIYSPRVDDHTSSDITILSAGSSHTGAADTYVMSQTSAVTWAVDIPVEGVMATPISRGIGGEVNFIDDGLVGISTATDFLPGLPSASLKDLARMARRTAHALTSGSRAGTRSLILRNWPETAMASPVMTGDIEMQRVAAGSAVVLQPPAVDVYVRSARDMQIETQTIRLDYVNTTLGEGSVRLFRGRVGLLHRPSRIVSIEWSGTTEESLVEGYTVYDRSTRSDLYGSLHCGTRFEELYVSLTPILDDFSTPRISLLEEEVDGETVQYAMFDVQYQLDPLLSTMASTLESADNAPAGVSILVKSGPLVLLNNLTISYARERGVRTTLLDARAKIVKYLRTAGYPDVFRQTAIHDIMREAGALRTLDISCNGEITVCASTRRFKPAITDPGGDDLTADWLEESVPLTPLEFNSVSGIVPATIVNFEVEDGIPEVWAATGRTVRYYVDPENVLFAELS